jgi:Protein of unknown function (DUF1602).
LAVDDAAVLHFVDPIARFGNCRIVRGEEQRLAAFMHKILQQLKRALGVCGVEIAGRFVARMTRGSFASARAIATRCCSPPER